MIGKQHSPNNMASVAWFTVVLVALGQSVMAREESLTEVAKLSNKTQGHSRRATKNRRGAMCKVSMRDFSKEATELVQVQLVEVLEQLVERMVL